MNILIDFFQERDIFLAHFDAASFHHDSGCFDGFIKLVLNGFASENIPRERFNVLFGETSARNVREHAANCACIKHSVDAEFGMVAHETSEELHSGINRFAFIIHPDLRVVVLEIARNRVRAEVHKRTGVRITDKPIVLLIDAGMKQRAGNFARYFRAPSDRAGSVNS